MITGILFYHYLVVGNNYIQCYRSTYLCSLIRLRDSHSFKWQGMAIWCPPRKLCGRVELAIFFMFFLSTVLTLCSIAASRILEGRNSDRKKLQCSSSRWEKIDFQRTFDGHTLLSLNFRVLINHIIFSPRIKYIVSVKLLKFEELP